MADGSTLLSKESQANLDSAKKGKPRRFVMVCKGLKVVSLVVYKKGSLQKFIKEAKGAVTGGQPSFGVVTGKGNELIFSLSKADGFEKLPTQNPMLKDLLTRAEYKANPKLEIVDTLPTVADDDESETGETESSEAGKKTPPQQQPRPLPPLPTQKENAPQAPAAAMAQQKERCVKVHAAWTTLRSTVNEALERVQQAIWKTYEQEADFDQIKGGTKGLFRVLDKLDLRLATKLKEANQATDPQDFAARRREALALVDEYQDFVAKDELLAALDDNPFEKVQVRSLLDEALAKLRKSLA